VRGMHRNTLQFLSALVFCGLIASGAEAGAIYSVTDLGTASPSAPYLSGQSQLDPSGNYLSALNGSQQAAFQQGSFDVYAHPATANNIYNLEFYLPGGDVRVVTIIDSDLSKIIDTIFRCGGIVPFPFRDGERNDTPRTVNASLASREACGRPVQLARVPPALCLIGQCPP
jgi:hypothetical protein